MPQRPAAPDPPEVIALVQQGMPLVDSIARQIHAALSLEVVSEELRSFGREGLLLAARSFDATRGVPFDRWCAIKIRMAMLEGVREESLLPRRLYARLRAILAANEAEEGLLEVDASSPPPTPEAADDRLSAYLEVLAASMAMGAMTVHDTEVLESIEDDRGTAEEQAILEEHKAYVRAAIAARPEQERRMLQGYYFEGKTLEEASGGLSRSWSCRILAQATSAVAKALRRANIDP